MPPTPERWPSADDPALVGSGSPPPEPVEERLADELSTDRANASGVRTRALAVLRRLGSYDRAVYRSVAHLATPLLDQPLKRVSGFANFSKPWFITAGLLALFGGPHGRRAALTGLAAIGAASLVVNQPMKLIGERHRPDRDGLGVPQQRWVIMPSSTSFPSGHSASAAAFAVAVGDLLPALKLPLRGAASVVAFSRVYTGVHYPSDVLVGATVGALLGRVASTVCAPRPGGPTRANIPAFV
jgi:membrane-associated phospholipid phosphatase